MTNPIDKLKERLNALDPKPDPNTYRQELLKLGVIVDDILKVAEIYREIASQWRNSNDPSGKLTLSPDEEATKLMEKK